MPAEGAAEGGATARGGPPGGVAEQGEAQCDERRPHGEISIVGGGLRYNGGPAPGAQTERRGDAGPVRLLLGGEDSPAALFRRFGHPFAGSGDHDQRGGDTGHAACSWRGRARAVLFFAGRFLLGLRCGGSWIPSRATASAGAATVKRPPRKSCRHPGSPPGRTSSLPLVAAPPLRHGEEEQGWVQRPAFNWRASRIPEALLESVHGGVPCSRPVVRDPQASQARASCGAISTASSAGPTASCGSRRLGSDQTHSEDASCRGLSCPPGCVRITRAKDGDRLASKTPWRPQSVLCDRDPRRRCQRRPQVRGHKWDRRGNPGQTVEDGDRLVERCWAFSRSPRT